VEKVTSLDRSKGWIALGERGGAGAVRRCIRAVSVDERMSDAVRDRAVLVGTELATNLVRHATGGELFVTGRGGGLDLLSLDRGPGFADLSAAMQDGYSTAGGLGDGMPIIERQSDAYEVRTGKEGSLIRARVGPEAAPRPWAVVERAYPAGYEGGWSCRSGDGWRVLDDGNVVAILMIDALGHGRRAAAAAERALALDDDLWDPEAMLRASAAAIGTSRGAVGAAVRIDRARREVTTAIVGNISARITGSSHSRRFAAKDGILGPRMPTLRPETAPLPPAHTLVLHTDGVSARRPVNVPASATPLMHAARIYRAGARVSDDACVMAFRIPEDER